MIDQSQVSGLGTTLLDKKARIESILKDMGSVLVAYSGGVDSTLLAVLAGQVLGSRALAVTAASPSLASEELEMAIELADRFGFRHRVIYTDEMDDPNYVANGPSRCYFCKDELYTRLRCIVSEEGIAWIANGTNADDLGDFRPGLDAAGKHGVRSPLVEAELSKAEVRELSWHHGLPNWDKPAQACLSSRIPYGTQVTVGALTRIGMAETFLRKLGFRDIRVRHYDGVARIEVASGEMSLLLEERMRRCISEHLKGLGYLYVTVDLAGFRSGSMNDALTEAQKGDLGALRRGKPEE